MHLLCQEFLGCRVWGMVDPVRLFITNIDCKVLQRNRTEIYTGATYNERNYLKEIARYRQDAVYVKTNVTNNLAIAKRTCF